MERAEAEAILDGDRETALALLMQVAELIEANRRLESRIADLERRLSRNSHNSSLPPSADPPSAPPRLRQAASGRRPGAQPGHAGKSRPLLALEQVDEVVDHWPDHCASCARHFREEERIEAAAPQRHQVCELPAIAVSVSEHRLHRLRCPACAGEALAGPYAHLHSRLKQAPALNIDETGWRTAGERRTLWGLLGARAALFRIAADRHRREAQALLGADFSGITCSDRWWAYDYLDPKRRQLCWAHLVRDFSAHSEGLGAQKEFGEAGLEIAGRLFAACDLSLIHI